jgi:hypothetical protein
MVSVLHLIYCYAECPYAECCHAECPYAECCHAACPYAECCHAALHVIMLSVAMLNVIMLSVAVPKLRLIYTSDLEVHFDTAFSQYISLPWPEIIHLNETPEFDAFTRHRRT